LAAGVGHPDQDAPANMPEGSQYFRTNGLKYKLTNTAWVEDIPSVGGVLGKLRVNKRDGNAVCLSTNQAGLPVTLRGGSQINIPLDCS